MMQNQVTAEAQTQSCKLFRFLILKLNHPEAISFLETTGDYWRLNNLTEFLIPAEIPKSLLILEDISLNSRICFLSWVWICVPMQGLAGHECGCVVRETDGCTDPLPGKSTDWSCCMCEYTVCVHFLYLCCDSMCCLQWRKLISKERLYTVPPPIVELVVPVSLYWGSYHGLLWKINFNFTFCYLMDI